MGMHMNSGYYKWSMSNRAVEAYDNGLAPLSVIGRSKFVRAAARFLGKAEAHHTSKFCNLTDFYDVRAVRALAAQLKATNLTAEAALAGIQAKHERRVDRKYYSIMRSDFRQARENILRARDYENAARQAIILAEREGAEHWETPLRLARAARNLECASALRWSVRQTQDTAS
jgi:hypothetical protein